MEESAKRRRIWGWFFFDWASQPYNTLLLTFIFAPYVKELLGDGTTAQTAWATGIALAGIVIAILAPFLGALADTGGNRLRWIWGFSVLYVVGAGMLWFAQPGDFDLWSTLLFFALGLIGMEFATIFTNAMLPDLGSREEIGRISGNGWAFGYLGGLVSAGHHARCSSPRAERQGTTLVGLDPAFGLDPADARGDPFRRPAGRALVRRLHGSVLPLGPRSESRSGAERRGSACAAVISARRCATCRAHPLSLPISLRRCSTATR